MKTARQYLGLAPIQHEKADKSTYRPVDEEALKAHVDAYNAKHKLADMIEDKPLFETEKISVPSTASIFELIQHIAPAQYKAISHTAEGVLFASEENGKGFLVRLHYKRILPVNNTCADAESIFEVDFGEVRNGKLQGEKTVEITARYGGGLTREKINAIQKWFKLPVVNVQPVKYGEPFTVYEGDGKDTFEQINSYLNQLDVTKDLPADTKIVITCKSKKIVYKLMKDNKYGVISFVVDTSGKNVNPNGGDPIIYKDIVYSEGMFDLPLNNYSNADLKKRDKILKVEIIPVMQAATAEPVATVQAEVVVEKVQADHAEPVEKAMTVYNSATANDFAKAILIIKRHNFGTEYFVEKSIRDYMKVLSGKYAELQNETASEKVESEKEISPTPEEYFDANDIFWWKFGAIPNIQRATQWNIWGVEAFGEFYTNHKKWIAEYQQERADLAAGLITKKELKYDDVPDFVDGETFNPEEFLKEDYDALYESVEKLKASVREIERAIAVLKNLGSEEYNARAEEMTACLENARYILARYSDILKDADNKITATAEVIAESVQAATVKTVGTAQAVSNIEDAEKATPKISTCKFSGGYLINNQSGYTSSDNGTDNLQKWISEVAGDEFKAAATVR